jgi:hypothetical protein
LKSTRMKTRLLANSMSRMESLGMMFSLKTVNSEQCAVDSD